MTKEEIMGAAFRVWGRDLYQNTSLTQLAKELKVSKPALYRHFENKQALAEAMKERFFDDFAAAIRPDYEKALEIKDTDEELSIVLRSIADFYARNVYDFIFSLINVIDRNINKNTVAESLKTRGIDLGAFQQILLNKYAAEPVMMRLVFSTLSFLMAYFHKTEKSFDNVPSDESIERIISVICKLTERGIGFSAGEIGALNYEELEKQVNASSLGDEPEPLFKAIAEAAAEAGPWEISMEMVAQRMGLSKSSLYGHFKNRKDMLRKLFITEFKRIIIFARQSIGRSSVPVEQLYLGIFSIAEYFRLRPEFLATLDWIRTRKLDLGKPEKQGEVARLFEDIALEPIKNGGEERKRQITHWILFLIVNILVRPVAAEGRLANNDMRNLFRFVTLGYRGFKC